MMHPLPAFVHEQNYKTILEAFSINHLSPSERIDALLYMPSQEFIERLPPNVTLLPILDEDIIPSGLSFSGIEKGQNFSQGWCKEMLIGDCKMDVSFWYFLRSSTFTNSSLFRQVSLALC